MFLRLLLLYTKGLIFVFSQSVVLVLMTSKLYNTCFTTRAGCTQRVCEDCASYSKIAEDEDAADWKCSVCRRKQQSRAALAQDSSESLLDVPLQELQRRHSEARLGGGGGLTVGAPGLAPPRSPELRRHSDVSPASLKELEKVIFPVVLFVMLQARACLVVPKRLVILPPF